MAKLNRRMNLVLEVTREDGSIAHVHSTPVSRAIYEDNFTLISDVMSEMYSRSYTPAVGSRVAYLMMKKIVKGDKAEEQRLDAFLEEVWRMTTLLVREEGSWQTLTFDQVIKGKLLSEDDIAGVQAAVCFFTAASWFHKLSELEELIYPAFNSGGQTTLLTSTEFKTSLPTSMPEENIGGKLSISSPPI